MAKHLVLVGGGHAHMTVLANLQRFIAKEHKVSVIAPSPYHYYSGMGPGMMGGTYSPEQIRFATRELVNRKGGNFIQDWVERVDPNDKRLYLASGGNLAYDVVSFNTGSHVPEECVAEDRKDIFSVKPIEGLIKARKRVLEASENRKITIAIVGGGPSAVEMAGNIWKITQKAAKYKPDIQILAGKKFLSRLPEKIRVKARASLKNRAINIHEKGYVRLVSRERIVFDSNQSVQADIIFLALGIRPSSIFKASGLPLGPDGGLLVNRFLQCPDHPAIFGGGDCICFQDQPLDKVGVYAVRQNPILYHNLMATLEGKILVPFDPGGKYLLILNMGDGTGIFYKNRLQFNGRPAFKFKDYIDRRFMMKFQSFE